MAVFDNEIESKEVGIKDCTNDSPAIGLQRKGCKSEKCESLPIFLRGLKVKISGFQTFPGGLKVKATCVQNLVFPALLEIRASSNGSPAIGLQRKGCKSEKCESLPIFLRGLKVKISGFQTFPGGLKVKATCVQNLVFPALLEVVTYAAVYIRDSPSARWGLRPQAPMMYACKFGDERLNSRLQIRG
ncbi:hypothetical protein J6590_097115 [Homalodisca vitripennis]|nr:hypothetical protein J6590_097115 [Homalodisca vitripennis]